jgi:uncharacterized protein YjbI with pentapeptide repeats
VKNVSDAKKIDPFEIGALESAVNDSAKRVSAIWITFLTFSLYLLIAVTTVTHRQLLLAEPLKLPVLNIDLPLWGFFFLAPILFVLLHIYVLLQVLLLGRTTAAYDIAVSRANLSPEENASLRQRLANTLFAQIFAGSPRERDGWLGWLLKVMAWTTLAIGPIVILLAFQFAFLPYHSHLATWMHRMLILVEIAVAFLLWPHALDSRLDFGWSDLGRSVLLLATCALFVFLSLSLATFPGEPHVNVFKGRPLSTVQCNPSFSKNFDRLHLATVDVVDDEKLANIARATSDRHLPPYTGERTRNFRGRDLNCIDLSSADLRRVDLAYAHLFGADLSSAALDGASLHGAQLQDGDLSFAKLRDVNLARARLQGAFLANADLQNAFLDETELQGASLDGARLQGASLDGAHLQGASLNNAQLQGASLDHGLLQGAELYGARLQGASLDNAQLQGASLDNAQLQGASLYHAQLQGTVLNKSALAHADLSGVYVWRAKGAACEDARVSAQRSDAVIETRTNSGNPDQEIDATPDEVAKFIDRSTSDIPDTRVGVSLEQAFVKIETRRRMRVRLTVDPAGNDTALIWTACAEAAKNKSYLEFDRGRAVYLRNFVCDTRIDRKAIVNGVSRTWGINDILSANPNRHEFFVQLARGLLGADGKKCAAIGDLDIVEKERLQATVAAETVDLSPTAAPAPQTGQPQ